MKETKNILQDRGVPQRLVNYFSALCGNAEPIIPALHSVLGDNPTTPSTSDSSYHLDQHQKGKRRKEGHEDDRKIAARIKTKPEKEKKPPASQKILPIWMEIKVKTRKFQQQGNSHQYLHQNVMTKVVALLIIMLTMNRLKKQR